MFLAYWMQIMVRTKIMKLQIMVSAASNSKAKLK